MATTFHLSLNVSNLDRALAFYRVLFGMEPAKCHDDYAKFELTEPPVIFSLVPQPSLAGGAISRLALRLSDADAVASVKQRLDAAGIPTQVPCNRDPDYYYVADPDLNFWEVSTGEDSSVAVEPPQPVERVIPAATAGPVVWEHYIAGPVVEQIAHADNTVDEARLTGTFNADLTDSQIATLMREVARVLRPGGKVVVHGLVGDRPFAQQPKLPGLAAMVQRVPVQTEPLAALRAAGLVAVQYVKFSEKAWFTIDGVELREVKLIATKAAAADGAAEQVMYRGPFAQAVDDAGNVFPRGRQVSIPAPAAAALKESAAAEQFLFLQPGVPVGSACSTGN